jgi:hypothetical protein
MSEDSDDTAWAASQRASFEVEPLIEMKGAEKVQVGFTFVLYARLPMEKPAGAERQEAGLAIWQRLRSVLQSVLPDQGALRVEIEPPRMAAVLRPENKMEPEVALKARVLHREDAFKPVGEDDRGRLSGMEKALQAKGLKAGHW